MGSAAESRKAEPEEERPGELKWQWMTPDDAVFAKTVRTYLLVRLSPIWLKTGCLVDRRRRATLSL